MQASASANPTNRIAANATVNKMGPVNLAIVFGMGLAPETTGFGISPDLGVYQTMVKTWITHASEIFPEVEDEEGDSVSMVRSELTDMPSSLELVGSYQSHTSEGTSVYQNEQQGEGSSSRRQDQSPKQRMELIAC